MDKILFLHGFFSSGSCAVALSMAESLKENCLVLHPDISLHPTQALKELFELCKKEKPKLIAGNSCGAFYAQILAQNYNLPALLGNPFFLMSRFLKERIGTHNYKSPRYDHKQEFTIDQKLIEEFLELEQRQFANYKPENKDKIWGLFADNDPIAHFEPLFLTYYDKSFHFPGVHTPTPEQVRLYYVPLIRQLLKI